MARAGVGEELPKPINPDDLTRAVIASFPGINADGANLVGVERAEKEVWISLAERRSVAVESVLSSDKYLRVVQAAKTRRFRTTLIFVSLPSVELSIERVRARVLAHGHDVPEIRIRTRWPKSHDNMVRFADLVDDVFVYSNAGDRPHLVARREGRRGAMDLFDPHELPEVTRRLWV